MIPADIRTETEKETAREGRFVISPLNQGYGHTLGNALRRVLLSSLPGAALTEVKIENVPHEFSTVAGVKEDVVEIILNLKRVRLKVSTDEPVALKLEKKGKGEVTAGDIARVAGVEVVSRDQHIATITNAKTRLSMELVAQRGYGYSPREERPSRKVGVLVLDAVFSPVLAANYWVEPTRVGQATNLDKLFLEIGTDGTVAPPDALKQASQVLVDYFFRLTQEEAKVTQARREKEEAKEKAKLNKKVSTMTLEELELPPRLINTLAKGKIKTVGGLLAKDEAELVKIKNVGEKSIQKIQQVLRKKGLL